MVDQIEVEITGRAVLLPVGMVALVEVEIPGRAVLLLVGAAALLAETTEVAEEALRQREILRKMWWLDDRIAPCPGQGRGPDSDDGTSHSCGDHIFFGCLSYVVHLFQSGLWDTFSSPPPEVIPEPIPTPAHRYPSSSRAPRIAQQPVAIPGPSTSVPQINCSCGKPSMERTATRVCENKGRRFRRCGQPASEDCKFFEWIDEPAQDGNAKLNRPPNPPLFPRRGPAQVMPYVFHMVSSMLTRTLKASLSFQGSIVIVI